MDIPTLESARRLAFWLHGDREVAWRVVLEALDYIQRIRSVQEHREGEREREREGNKRRSSGRQVCRQESPGPKGPIKLSIPEEGFLQYAVYFISERLERGQENTKRPSPEIMLARYLKFLIHKTTELNSFYVAAGIGHFLYDYSLCEIESLADLFNLANNRSLDEKIQEWIEQRFGRNLRKRTPSAEEKELVRKYLEIFTPWWTKHIKPAEADELFGYSHRDAKSEWQRIHALLDTKCFGLGVFMRNHKKAMGLGEHDADEHLKIPDFDFPEGARSSQPGNDPAYLEPLCPETILTVEHMLKNQNRRRKRHVGSVRLCVDGEQYLQFDPDRTPAQSVRVPLDSHFVEIFGEDDQGDLLIDVFPLPGLEEGEGAKRVTFETHDPSQSVELLLSPQREEDGGEVTEFLLQIKYLQVDEIAIPSLWDRYRQVLKALSQTTVRIALTVRDPIGRALHWARNRTRRIVGRSFSQKRIGEEDAAAVRPSDTPRHSNAKWRAIAIGEALLLIVILVGTLFFKQHIKLSLVPEGIQVKAAIDEGFRNANKLQRTIDSTQQEEDKINAARQIEVVSLQSEKAGKSYPYPLWGQKLFDKEAIGAGLSRLPDLQQDYIEYLQEWSDIFLDLGDILVQTGKLDGAIQVFEFLREKEPTSKHLLFSLGELYKMKGDHRKAIFIYEEMIPRDSLEKDPRSTHYAGWSYFVLGDFQKALEYYDLSLSIYPEYAKVYYNKALVYKEQGLHGGEGRLYRENLQKAIDLTLAAYEKEKDENPRIPFTLAILYAEREQYNQALQVLERALQKDRTYVARSEKERAFEKFRDLEGPFHMEFVNLLNRYRPPVRSEESRRVEATFDPDIFWE